MALLTTAMGISIDTVSTDLQCPLGFEAVDIDQNTWIYVQNGAVALAAGELCSRIGGATAALSLTGIVTSTNAAATATSGCVLGVAQHVIGIDEFGFILRSGAGLVTGTYAVGNTIQNDAPGAAIATNTAGDESFGVGIVLNSRAVVDCRG